MSKNPAISNAPLRSHSTEGDPAPLRAVKPEAGKLDFDKLSQMEQRLRILESAVVKNAIELRDRVSERLERIEKKLDSEVMNLTGEEPQIAPDFSNLEIDNNVVVFPSNMHVESDRLVQHTATEFLSEFSETLTVTREHLEALTQSISKMRVELSS